MTETEGEMWRRLAANGSAVNWDALGGTIVFSAECFKGPYVTAADPRDWQIIDWRQDEKAIRADERKLCVRAIRAEAADYVARAESFPEKHGVSGRLQCMAAALEQIANTLEGRHV